MGVAKAFRVAAVSRRRCYLGIRVSGSLVRTAEHQLHLAQEAQFAPCGKRKARLGLPVELALLKAIPNKTATDSDSAHSL